MNTAWPNRYIGTPWREFGRDGAGCDCWGLACIIYQAELGIALPDYLGYGSVDEHAEISALVEGATSSPLWCPVSGLAAPFDVAVFRRGRLASHIGLVIRPGLMIHVEGRDCAKIADYRRGAWGHRFIGHYRHVSRGLQPGGQA